MVCGSAAWAFPPGGVKAGPFIFLVCFAAFVWVLIKEVEVRDGSSYLENSCSENFPSRRREADVFVQGARLRIPGEAVLLLSPQRASRIEPTRSGNL
jgi:hypothetical protein